MKSERWSGAATALHWVAAALFVALFAAGFVMTDLAADDPLRRLLGRLHTLGGIALGATMLVRVVVRLRARAVEPLDMPSWQRRGISVVHALLYVVAFALVLTGVGMALSSAWPEFLKGSLAQAPDLSAVAPRQGHGLFVNVLLALIGAHVVGVFVNELRRGRTLRRMVPFLR